MFQDATRSHLTSDSLRLVTLQSPIKYVSCTDTLPHSTASLGATSLRVFQPPQHSTLRWRSGWLRFHRQPEHTPADTDMEGA